MPYIAHEWSRFEYSRWVYIYKIYCIHKYGGSITAADKKVQTCFYLVYNPETLLQPPHPPSPSFLRDIESELFYREEPFIKNVSLAETREKMWYIQNCRTIPLMLEWFFDSGIFYLLIIQPLFDWARTFNQKLLVDRRLWRKCAMKIKISNLIGRVMCRFVWKTLFRITQNFHSFVIISFQNNDQILEIFSWKL